jgi:hypothetical protein
MTSRNAWCRVSRRSPCPICEKPDWCAVSDDGAVALCQRVESPQRVGEAGWLHRLKDACDRERRFVRTIRLGPIATPRADLERQAAQHRETADAVRLLQLADSLGVSLEGLCRLGVGWSPEHRAWSFPMTDSAGHVLGIRLRRPNGFKFSVSGGKEGLFIPSTRIEGERCPLLVCEGPTDTAALLDMRFDNVVGRPSCTGGMKALVELVQRRLPPEVVIVSDGDEPGRRGADNLASVLVIYAPAVRIISPPTGIKDAREWLQVGGCKRDVEQAIDAAVVRRLTIRVENRKAGERG